MKPRLSDGQSVFLDFVRGLSAFAVLLGHTLAYIPNPPALGTFYPIQSYAVVIFFVLSGFLICLSTLSKPNYSYGAYLIDRFSRVYTAFLPAVFLVIIVDTLIGRMPPAGWSYESIISNLTLMMGIPFDKAHYALPHFQQIGTGRPFWTVAVEWWLYVAFGFMVFLPRLRLGSGLIAIILTPIACLVVYVYGARESLALVWFMSAAVAIPALRLDKEACKRVGPALLLFWGIIAFWKLMTLRAGAGVNFYDAQFMYFSTAVIFSLLLCVKAFDWLEKIMLLIRPFSRWLADISYSLYLTHYTLLIAFGTFFDMSWFSAFVFIILAMIFAWGFTVLFDRKYRKVANLLKRVFLRDAVTTRKSLREETMSADVETSKTVSS